jgi:ornithine racemase
MSGHRIVIALGTIRGHAPSPRRTRAVIALCREHGAEVACVTKVMGAHPAILHALEAARAAMIGDSRVANLQSIAKTTLTLPALLLRVPTPSRVVDVVG